eukprot:evm.model.scf_425EXC.5 EVM.evm.TU.scf_425EXC.5   scf_425EXC:26650-30233(+)
MGSKRWLGFVSRWGSVCMTALTAVSLLCVLYLTLYGWRTAHAPDGAGEAPGEDPPQGQWVTYMEDWTRAAMEDGSNLEQTGEGNGRRGMASPRSQTHRGADERRADQRKRKHGEIQPKDKMATTTAADNPAADPSFSLSLLLVEYSQKRAKASLMLAIALVALHIWRLCAKLVHARADVVEAQRLAGPVQWTVFKNSLARVQSRSPSPGAAMTAGHADSEPGDAQAVDWQLMAADGGGRSEAPSPTWEPLPVSVFCDTSHAKAHGH